MILLNGTLVNKKFMTNDSIKYNKVKIHTDTESHVFAVGFMAFGGFAASATNLTIRETWYDGVS